MIIKSPASTSNKTAAIWLIYFKNLGVSVSVQNCVEILDHKKIHEEQDALIEAEAEPAEVKNDEGQAPVSAKEAPKCCLLLRFYFVRLDVISYS